MPDTFIAIMYDFDKTLCTKDMQEYSFIPKLGMSSSEFWSAADSLAKDKKMDSILAYMYLMITKATAAQQKILRQNFVELGSDLEFFPGVETWFERINRYGEEANVKIEHYIISSGLREIIEGSSIYKNFKEVFACEFLYDINGVACWPKNAVNYTTKTQFLFRISKGVLDISQDNELNRYTPEEDRRIPFMNMIYIGDGLTDVPCMKLVKSYGGSSLAVYKADEKAKVDDLLLHSRVDFTILADYTENSELDVIVKDTIKHIALSDLLRRKNKQQIDEIKKL